MNYERVCGYAQRTAKKKYLQIFIGGNTTDQDRYEEGNDKVTLMTAHASKGLSLACICGGMEDDLFPSSMTKSAVRIRKRAPIYVAITRKQTCIITYADRFKHGKLKPMSESFLE